MSDKVTWLDHEFSVHQHGENWNAVAGLYIFSGLNSERLWVPYYIGQAESFDTRLPTHERWQEAARLGATHVHAMVVPLQANRDSIEKALIQAYQPPLNVQLKPPTGLLGSHMR